uniref:Uncharacterized protein n=1 Tax=Cajanus cajan TaxID=3821 RepID=A0A151QXG9_CAJCA|nr:hypothetical protein KK1_044037 [Cajanus cajan]
MLEAALKYKKAFDLLEMQDNKYVEDLHKGKGVPLESDWNDARLLLPFLKMFYDATIRISGSYHVTSYIYIYIYEGSICNWKEDSQVSRE